MPDKFAFTFSASLSRIEDLLVHTVVYIPAKVFAQLPAGRVRTKGVMNDAPFSLAVQYRKNGQSFFMVSAPLRRAAKIKLGDRVKVSFNIVDSTKVDLPEELLAVLEQDPEGAKVWKSFTPGKQRSLAHYVWSVKNVDSRIKRSLFLIEKAKQGEYSKKPASKKD